MEKWLNPVNIRYCILCSEWQWLVDYVDYGTPCSTFTEGENSRSHVDRRRDEAFDRSILELPIDNLGRKKMEGFDANDGGAHMGANTVQVEGKR